MTESAPAWIDAVAAALLAAGGDLVLVSAFGFVTLRDFFLRMHPPALAYTLGSWTVALAGILTFSTRSSNVSLHPWLVVVLLALVVPVTTAVLARAALFRLRQAMAPDAPPPLGRSNAGERSDSGDQHVGAPVGDHRARDTSEERVRDHRSSPQDDE